VLDENIAFGRGVEVCSNAMAQSMGLISFFKYRLFEGRYIQCECKPAQCSFGVCVSCCLQMTVRPPGCGNNLFGPVGGNQKFLTNMLLPSSGSAWVGSQGVVFG
jgi:hypothetical protein